MVPPLLEPDWPVQDTLEGIIDEEDPSSTTLEIGSVLKSLSGSDVYMARQQRQQSAAVATKKMIAILPGLLNIQKPTTTTTTTTTSTSMVNEKETNENPLPEETMIPSSTNTTAMILGRLEIPGRINNTKSLAQSDEEDGNNNNNNIRLQLGNNNNNSHNHHHHHHDTDPGGLTLIGRTVPTKSQFLWLKFIPGKKKQPNIVACHIANAISVFGKPTTTRSQAQSEPSSDSSLLLQHSAWNHYGGSIRTVDGNLRSASSSSSALVQKRQSSSSSNRRIASTTKTSVRRSSNDSTSKQTPHDHYKKNKHRHDDDDAFSILDDDDDDDVNNNGATNNNKDDDDILDESDIEQQQQHRVPPKRRRLSSRSASRQSYREPDTDDDDDKSKEKDEKETDDDEKDCSEKEKKKYEKIKSERISGKKANNIQSNSCEKTNTVDENDDEKSNEEEEEEEGTEENPSNPRCVKSDKNHNRRSTPHHPKLTRLRVKDEEPITGSEKEDDDDDNDDDTGAQEKSIERSRRGSGDRSFHTKTTTKETIDLVNDDENDDPLVDTPILTTPKCRTSRSRTFKKQNQLLATTAKSTKSPAMVNLAEDDDDDDDYDELDDDQNTRQISQIHDTPDSQNIHRRVTRKRTSTTTITSTKVRDEPSDNSSSESDDNPTEDNDDEANEKDNIQRKRKNTRVLDGVVDKQFSQDESGDLKSREEKPSSSRKPILKPDKATKASTGKSKNNSTLSASDITAESVQSKRRYSDGTRSSRTGADGGVLVDSTLPTTPSPSPTTRKRSRRSSPFKNPSDRKMARTVDLPEDEFNFMSSYL